MLTALLGLLTIAAPLGAGNARALAASAGDHDAPGIRVWISSRDLFHRGDRPRVFYRTERDAFVTVLRVDTDGRVDVLFPRGPDDDNYAYGGTTYAVSGSGRNEAFVVDDDPGVGYLFAVASEEPFDYHALLDGQRWDTRLASGGRVHGDPLQTLEEMVVQTLPEGYTDFDTHLIPYYVEQRYDYPRFVCYDCHAYMPYSYWDPYSAWCPRYTLVVWHDPFYYYPSYWYPTRYYGGTRVVYVNPGGGTSDRGRYVFKDRGNSEPGIDYRDRRAGTTPERRAAERFVRGIDVGGVGSVPAPGRRVTDPGRRQVVDVPSGGEGLTPGGAPDARRRAPERQDAGTMPADDRRGTGLVPTQPALTPEAPAGRRNAVLWQSPESWSRQQPAPTERRASGGENAADKPASGRRTEGAQAQRDAQTERRAAPPPMSKPGAQAAPSNRGGSQPSTRGSSEPQRGGGSQPSARGSAPSSRGSAPSARPSGGGGSRPASPGLVRRRPS